MNSDLKHPSRILESGLAAMRNRSADSGRVEEAVSRVLHNLEAEHAKVVAPPASAEAQGIDRIRGCDDFRNSPNLQH